MGFFKFLITLAVIAIFGLGLVEAFSYYAPYAHYPALGVEWVLEGGEIRSWHRNPDMAMIIMGHIAAIVAIFLALLILLCIVTLIAAVYDVMWGDGEKNDAAVDEEEENTGEVLSESRIRELIRDELGEILAEEPSA